MVVKSICIVAMINDSKKGFSFSLHLAIAFVMLFIPSGWSSFQVKHRLEFQRKALKIVFFSIYSYLGCSAILRKVPSWKASKMNLYSRIDGNFQRSPVLWNGNSNLPLTFLEIKIKFFVFVIWTEKMMRLASEVENFCLSIRYFLFFVNKLID